MADYINSTVLTAARVSNLRLDLQNTVNQINNHIGNSGSIHPNADRMKKGFMSTEQVTQIEVTIPALMNELQAAIDRTKIPTGTIVWYYGDPESLPSDWELVSDNTSSPLYKATTEDSNGTSVCGTKTVSANTGDVYTVYGNLSRNSTSDPRTAIVNTIALYLIRKK